MAIACRAEVSCKTITELILGLAKVQEATARALNVVDKVEEVQMNLCLTVQFVSERGGGESQRECC